MILATMLLHPLATPTRMHLFISECWVLVPSRLLSYLANKGLAVMQTAAGLRAHGLDTLSEGGERLMGCKIFQREFWRHHRGRHQTHRDRPKEPSTNKSSLAPNIFHLFVRVSGGRIIISMALAVCQVLFTVNDHAVRQ